MYHLLKEREARGQPLRVALVGAGAMGVGIAWQLRHSPGLELVSVTDIDVAAARRAAEAYGGPHAEVGPDDPLPEHAGVLVTRTPFLVRDRPELAVDVLVEATNTVGFAATVALAALRRRIHVVLMNAEVDLALGPLLHDVARKHDVVVTSDAGDQHGVLMRLIDEVRLWALDVVMAGNMKGYLDRYATPESIVEEARARNLSPVQCCAYTDGTKLGVEMALVANATGLTPWVPGMEGPRAAHVDDVLSLFDFERYGQPGVVDYILGAEPGGGVFVVGHCDDPLQQRYLRYYKRGDGPYYLFYRPYHLCHLETPWAIAAAALDGRPVLRPSYGRVADVYAVAKRDLAPGDVIAEGIGGFHCYGRIERCDQADPAGRVPIALLEGEGAARPRMRRAVPRDQALCRDDIEWPQTELRRLDRQQAALLEGGDAPQPHEAALRLVNE